MNSLNLVTIPFEWEKEVTSGNKMLLKYKIGWSPKWKQSGEG